MARRPTSTVSIKDISARQAREIGRRYQLRLTGHVGTTFERMFVFLAAQLAFIFLSQVVVNRIASLFGFENVLFFLVGWVLLALLSAPLFLVNVPKITALVVTSYFGGVLHVFGSGLHIKFPWEHYGPGDYIDLRAVAVEGTSRFVVRGTLSEGTEVSRGAVGVSFSWTIQYTPLLRLLALHVRTELKAISEGLKEVVENAISEALLHKTIKEMLDKKTIDEVQRTLANAFRGLDKDGKPAPEFLDETGSTLQERFGFMIELSTLGPPNFDEDYTEALRSQTISGILVDEAALMAKTLGISTERAMQIKLIINKEAVTQNIVTIQADERIEHIAEDIGRVLATGGEIARAVNRPKHGGGEGHSTPPSDHGGH